MMNLSEKLKKVVIVENIPKLIKKIKHLILFSGRYIQTIKSLKSVQIFYQIKYKCFKTRSLKRINRSNLKSNPLSLCNYPSVKSSITKSGTGYRVSYLNLETSFQNQIDWTFDKYGKLWNYNLQYAGFLNQVDLSEEKRLHLIIDLYNGLMVGSPTPEPYTASLRIMNVIRFLSKSDLIEERRKSLDSAVYSELSYLFQNLEYHLLGNHLLENSFALLMGGFYFSNETLIDKAQEILIEELNEQILKDGGHFERSPMYHNIILYRVLEAISYLRTDHELEKVLRNSAKKMVGWMLAMQFKNGSVPHFNDSVDGVAVSNSELLQLANELNIGPIDLMELKESGYRKYISGKFEVFVDVEGIKPIYQPGHAHADSLSFQLSYNEKPFLIDPGVSTYTSGERRNWERSTKAHNTVCVEGRNSADVWGSFRVGKRPKVNIEKDLRELISARIQTGLYEHSRTFNITSSAIRISDNVKSRAPMAIVYFYLHPSIDVIEHNIEYCVLNNGCKIQTDSEFGIQIESYHYAMGFNQLIEGKRCSISFKSNCITEIISA